MLADATVELLEVDAVGLTVAAVAADCGDFGVLRVLAAANSAAVKVTDDYAGAGSYTTSKMLPLCLRGQVIGSMDLLRTAELAALSLPEAFTAMRSYARGRGCGLTTVAKGVLDGTLQTSALLAR